MNILKNNIALFYILLITQFSFSQEAYYNIYDYSQIENYQLNSNPSYHTTLREFSFIDFKYDTISIFNSSLDKIFNDDAYSLYRNKTFIKINPLLRVHSDVNFTDKQVLPDFRAGLSIKSNLKDKLKFWTNIYYAKTKLSKFNALSANNTGVVPHLNKFINSENGFYNYIVTDFSLSYKPAEYISFEIGNGRNFIGNGYRSLLLSANTVSYPYFKATVDIWKVKYIWMISRLKDNNLIGNNQKADLYNKFTFTHYLSLNLTKRINFNLFETVITNSYDQSGKRGIDLSYFNPVIFYRPVEFATGTYDNALMGLGLNIRLWKKVFLYSQFILDDMIVAEVRAGNGWWANKFGMQAGIKVYDFLKVKNLFVLGEINAVRPYTYSHGRDNINYGNMYQPLAHPLGANFAEAVSIIKYSHKRWSIQSKVIIAKYGADYNNDVSYGSDIYKSYELRPDKDGDSKPDNYGVEFLQGDNTDYYYIDLNLSYLLNLKSGLKIETGFIARKNQNSIINQNDKYFYFGLSSLIFNSSIEN